jgi:hypothetical protein
LLLASEREIGVPSRVCSSVGVVARHREPRVKENIMQTTKAFLSMACAALVAVGSARAGSVFQFSTGKPDGLIATASRPASLGKPETETADDFILPTHTKLKDATFTGILTGGATVADVGRITVDIYRVFPNDSDTGRTITVPTRVNSPGDNEIDGRDSADNSLEFIGFSDLNPNFSVINSVVNGIHASPNQTTGGEGPVSGDEVLFIVTFTTPFDLPAGHYFFRPEVEVAGGDFLWLSAGKPIVAPGTPFVPDLQSWTRNADLSPDWLRIGTDIVGGAQPPTFNAAFSLSGNAVPLPPAFWPAMTTFAVLGLAQRWARFRRIRR